MIWRWLDTAAHFLYCPGMLGRHGARYRRGWHDIHLIPGGWLRWVCDRYDHALGMTWEEIRRGYARVDDPGVDLDESLARLDALDPALDVRAAAGEPVLMVGTDFYEEDEPVGEVRAAFDRGEKR